MPRMPSSMTSKLKLNDVISLLKLKLPPVISTTHLVLFCYFTHVYVSECVCMYSMCVCLCLQTHPDPAAVVWMCGKHTPFPPRQFKGLVQRRCFISKQFFALWQQKNWLLGRKTVPLWHQYFAGLKQRITYARGWGRGLQQTYKTNQNHATTIFKRTVKSCRG